LKIQKKTLKLIFIISLLLLSFLVVILNIQYKHDKYVTMVEPAHELSIFSYGFLLYEHGSLYGKGFTKDGLKQGSWTFYYRGGKEISDTGCFVNGLKSGQWVSYMDGKVTSVINYKNGVPEGKAMDKNTMITYYTYRNGKKNGEERTISLDGFPIEQGNWQNDKKEGDWYIYEMFNPDCYIIESYRDGQIVKKEYYQNKILMNTATKNIEPEEKAFQLRHQ
jgi:antitoxin component YwqK of YwqJK toxin-antitoxin module